MNNIRAELYKGIENMDFVQLGAIKNIGDLNKFYYEKLKKEILDTMEVDKKYRVKDIKEMLVWVPEGQIRYAMTALDRDKMITRVEEPTGSWVVCRWSRSLGDYTYRAFFNSLEEAKRNAIDGDNLVPTMCAYFIKTI